MPSIIPFPSRPALAPATPAGDPVRAAYDTLAPAYDAFTAEHRHDLWLPALERLARRHGLGGGRRVLDVACGTGKSFLPLLARGYSVTACDLSPEMVRRAARKAPAAQVCVADMRCLPALGRFDLVTCLDDTLGSLLDADELRRTLAGIAAQLAPGGLALWDVATLSALRAAFSSDWIADRGDWFLAWQGLARPALEPGSSAEARIDAFQRRGETWQRTTSRHRHRHWPVVEVLAATQVSGLRVVDVLGLDGARSATLDERVHGKALFVARRAP